MKKAIILSVALILTLCISFNLLSVKALNSNEWTATYQWSAQALYQGDNSDSVTITFSSSCPDQVQISSIGIQFDWMTSPTSETVSSPDIATGGQYTFSPITFSIPADATVGTHTFTLSIQGQEQGLLGWYSISVTGTGSINVLDAYELIYDNTLTNVQSSLNSAQNSNYQSPNAQSLLQQANNMYNQATSLATQGQWQNAVNDLNTASNDLSQAQAAEASYTTPSPNTNNSNGIPEFPAIVILAIFLVLSLIVVSVLAIRKQKMGKS